MILAACTGDNSQQIIIDYVREKGWTIEDVKILKQGECTWVERQTSSKKSDLELLSMGVSSGEITLES